uniref:Uncharacterized protein n=1 Tax=Rhodnius prolixus TaxID=13249 RepID=T1IBP4_RHOPR
MKYLMLSRKQIYGVKRPICVVSGANYLTIGGWVDLRNRSDYEPPFRLYVDEGRTFLQVRTTMLLIQSINLVLFSPDAKILAKIRQPFPKWLGESELRITMEGRILLVNLLCKESQDSDQTSSNIFTPCLAFRAAGIPGDSTVWSGIREVSFSTDPSGEKKIDNGYLLMALSSVLLGVVYVTAIFAYLRSRHRKTTSIQNRTGSPGEEHVVKSNPLLVHCRDTLVYLNEGSQSAGEGDSETTSTNNDNTNSQPQVKITSALVHGARDCQQTNLNEAANDTGSIECLPEENVSIIESLEQREEKNLDLVGAVSVRRKLYFNPAYFEPELLMAPPPGAIEFLTKIREVMSFAKTKIMAKRFLPSLMAIPEESCCLLECNNNSDTKFLDNSIKIQDEFEFNIRRWLDNMPLCLNEPTMYNSIKTNHRVYEEKLPKYELQLEIVDDTNLLLDKKADCSTNHYEIIELNDTSSIIDTSFERKSEPTHNDYELISVKNEFCSLPDLTELESRSFNSNDGFLSIQLEEPVMDKLGEDSEEIEPDTLDRKQNRFPINEESRITRCHINEDIYFDSLERSVISLKTSGTFTGNSLLSPKQKSLNRAFGSLKDIFEAKYKYSQCVHKKFAKNRNVQYPKTILQPEARQAKRQRQPGATISPPESQNAQHLNLTQHICISKPKLDKPKNIAHTRPEDLGYLSTESNDSQQIQNPNNKESQSDDTDDSVYDAASESGAESTATDSFFFGKIKKCSVLKALNNTNNSMGQNSSDTDSNISLITVIP